MVCQAKEGVEQGSCTAFSCTDDYYAVLPTQGDTVFMRDINRARYCHQHDCRIAGILHRVDVARSYKYVKHCNLVNCPNSFAFAAGFPISFFLGCTKQQQCQLCNATFGGKICCHSSNIQLVC
jgi:hypothetical protein